MNLGQLKKMLETQPVDKVCAWGFGEPHAHRGYYNHVSFPPNEPDVTIGQMLEYVNEALSHPFEGWKGGEYSYNEDTQVHFNFEGVCDDDDVTMRDSMLTSIFG